MFWRSECGHVCVVLFFCSRGDLKSPKVPTRIVKQEKMSHVPMRTKVILILGLRVTVRVMGNMILNGNQF